MGTQPHTLKGAEPSIFGPRLLWPNGCMDQDATWYCGRLRPTRHCVRWEPSSSPLKGLSPPPIFGQCPLWPNGLLDYDATCYGGRPRPRRLCVRWGPSYPQKKRIHPPHPILAHVYCGQTAGWMKTPLGTEVDLGPGHIVLDKVPAPAKGAQQLGVNDGGGNGARCGGIKVRTDATKLSDMVVASFGDG